MQVSTCHWGHLADGAIFVHAGLITYLEFTSTLDCFDTSFLSIKLWTWIFNIRSCLLSEF